MFIFVGKRFEFTQNLLCQFNLVLKKFNLIGKLFNKRCQTYITLLFIGFPYEYILE